jgi:hypothetical protein
METDLPVENKKFSADFLPKITDAHNGEDDPLTTSATVIRGYDELRIPSVHDSDFIGPKFPIPNEVEFIGPHDAYDDGRMFLLQRIKDVAHIAVADVVESPKYHAQLVTAVMDEIAAGHVRLSGEYPEHHPHAQTIHFIQDIFKAELAEMETVTGSIVSENVQTIVSLQDTMREQTEEIEKLKKIQIEAQLKLLRLRHSLKASNISDEQLAIFDDIAKIPLLTNTPHHEIEPTKSTTGNFWHIVSNLSRKTFESMGIVAPKSAEVTIVNLHESIPKY